MQNKRQTCGSKFKRMDSFKQHVKFNFDGGKTFFQTKFGAFISIVQIIIVLLFAIQRLIVMIGRQNNSIYQHQEFDETLRTISS
jgi:hypothetical protein